MDTKPVECFGTDPRARGVRIDLSPQASLALPHEHFVYAESNAGPEQDTLKLYFVSHEVVIAGHGLRHIESAILAKDPAWVTARTDRYRPQAGERGFVSSVTVRLLDGDEENVAKSGRK